MSPGRKKQPRALPLGLEMLYEDHDVLVVNKPAGLLSISTDRQQSRTAYFVMTDYVRKGNHKSPNRIYVVHRLDRETSGVLVFAKTENAKLRLQEDWDQTEKRYLAVVHGRPPLLSDVLVSYLAENSVHVVYSTSDPEKGKLSKTAYRVLKQGPVFSLLELDLLTGRKNQIRVQLSDMGHPIVGDKKYGKRKDSQKRLALHALSVTFPHPYSGEWITCIAEPPSYFRHMVGEIYRDTKD